MNSLSIFLQMAWRAFVCALSYAVALVSSRLFFHTIGITPPRMPQQAEEAIAGYYLLAGSVVLTLGLIPLVRRIQATVAMRWILLSAFLFLIFGIGNSVEDSIYSTTEGITLLIPILFLPCVVLAGVLTFLIRPTDRPRLWAAVSEFFAARTFRQWAWRVTLSIGGFPLVYFIFGIIVSPFVTEYYTAGIADLMLPQPGTIVAIELLRGVLFVVASIPLLIFWSGSRRQMILFLGLAFFVLMATFEIVMAYQLPVAMRAIHTVEILAGSIIYAWLVVLLLFDDPTESLRGA